MPQKFSKGHVASCPLLELWDKLADLLRLLRFSAARGVSESLLFLAPEPLLSFSCNLQMGAKQHSVWWITPSEAAKWTTHGWQTWQYPLAISINWHDSFKATLNLGWRYLSSVSSLGRLSFPLSASLWALSACLRASRSFSAFLMVQWSTCEYQLPCSSRIFLKEVTGTVQCYHSLSHPPKFRHEKHLCASCLFSRSARSAARCFSQASLSFCTFSARSFSRNRWAASRSFWASSLRFSSLRSSSRRSACLFSLSFVKRSCQKRAANQDASWMRLLWQSRSQHIKLANLCAFGSILASQIPRKKKEPTFATSGYVYGIPGMVCRFISRLEPYCIWNKVALKLLLFKDVHMLGATDLTLMLSWRAFFCWISFFLSSRSFCGMPLSVSAALASRTHSSCIKFGRLWSLAWHRIPRSKCYWSFLAKGWRFLQLFVTPRDGWVLENPAPHLFMLPLTIRQCLATCLYEIRELKTDY